MEIETSTAVAFRRVRTGIREDQLVRRDSATRNGGIVSDREPRMNL